MAHRIRLSRNSDDDTTKRWIFGDAMTDQHNNNGSPPLVEPLSENEIGSTLRRAREAKGMAVSDVAKVLRIDPRHIEAVESEDYSKVSGSVFVRGYVRNYARLLGLDPVPLIAAFDRSGQSQQPKMARVGGSLDALPNQNPRERKGVVRKIISVLITVIFILVVAWSIRETLHLEGVNLESFTTKEAPDSHSALTLPNMPSSVASAPEVPVPAATGSMVSPGMELALPVPSEAAVASLAVPSVPEPLAEPAPIEPTIAAKPLEITPTKIRATIGLEFGRESYAKVIDARKKTLFSQMGKPGEKRWLTGTAPFTVTMGSPNDLMLNINGQAVSLPATVNQPNAIVVVGLDGVQ